MAATNEHIHHLLSLLPDSPGVYQYFDKEGNIIYVGKAKNLKRRVSSYFNKKHESLRTTMLVRNICDIKYTVVGSEEDALHLENSFIKEYKPRYNVLLKDDKTYPWITVRNEPFPRVFLTRKVIHDGSKYYGPYANVQLARTVIELIRSIYPIRTCSHLLSAENIERHKYKVCLQYHIKNCKGPCEGMQSEADYREEIDQIRQILSGNIQQLTDHLKEEMNALAEQLKFEEAQQLKEKYLLLEKYKAKSVIVSSTIHNVDVFSYAEDENDAYVNYLHVRNGSIVQSYTLEYRKRLDETREEILSLAIAELRQRFKSESHEIIVPFLPESEFKETFFTVPQRGRQAQTARSLRAECQAIQARQGKKCRETQPRTTGYPHTFAGTKRFQAAQPAHAHRVLRQLQHSGHPAGIVVRGLQKGQTIEKRLPPFQREECRRAR